MKVRDIHDSAQLADIAYNHFYAVARRGNPGCCVNCSVICSRSVAPTTAPTRLATLESSSTPGPSDDPACRTTFPPTQSITLPDTPDAADSGGHTPRLARRRRPGCVPVFAAPGFDPIFMAKVLMLGQVHDVGVNLLRARTDVNLEIAGRDELRLAELVRDAHAILARTTVIDRPIIDAAEALQIVSRHGVGYDTVDVPALTERGIPVTITPGSNSPSVAEHTLFMLLALAKHCLENDRETRAGDFTARAALRPVDIAERTC